MRTVNAVDSWWSRRASSLLGLALLFLAAMTVWLAFGQEHSKSDSAKQSDKIASLEYTQDSLSKALDDQRQAAKDGGAKVVVPPSDKIVKDPNLVTIPGRQGDPGTPGDQGIPGSPGATGAAGSNGKDGTPGSPGASGPPGVPGTSATGAPGKDGQDGAPGAKGDQGDPGVKGDKGDTGNTGAQGEPGKSPTKLTITFLGIRYTCVPTSAGSTDYDCQPDTGVPAPGGSPSPATYLGGVAYVDNRRWLAT